MGVRHTRLRNRAGGGDAAMIPRKLAYRIWADSLTGRAVALRTLTDDHTIERARERGGTAAVENARYSIHARREAARQYERFARRIGGWIGDRAKCHGADLEPEFVLWLIAYLYRDGRALPELRRWTDRHGRS